MPKPALKLMTEYGSWPIWRHDGPPGNVDPRELGISERLAQGLENWSATYDSHLNVSDPAATSWSAEEEKSFDAEGRRLCLALAEEIGARYSIVYSSQCIPVSDLSTYEN